MGNIFTKNQGFYYYYHFYNQRPFFDYLKPKVLFLEDTSIYSISARVFHCFNFAYWLTDFAYAHPVPTYFYTQTSLFLYQFPSLLLPHRMSLLLPLNEYHHLFADSFIHLNLSLRVYVPCQRYYIKY